MFSQNEITPFGSRIDGMSVAGTFDSLSLAIRLNGTLDIDTISNSISKGELDKNKYPDDLRQMFTVYFHELTHAFQLYQTPFFYDLYLLYSNQLESLTQMHLQSVKAIHYPHFDYMKERYEVMYRNDIKNSIEMKTFLVLHSHIKWMEKLLYGEDAKLNEQCIENRDKIFGIDIARVVNKNDRITIDPDKPLVFYGSIPM